MSGPTLSCDIVVTGTFMFTQSADPRVALVAKKAGGGTAISDEDAKSRSGLISAAKSVMVCTTRLDSWAASLLEFADNFLHLCTSPFKRSLKPGTTKGVSDAFDTANWLELDASFLAIPRFLKALIFLLPAKVAISPSSFNLSQSSPPFCLIFWYSLADFLKSSLLNDLGFLLEYLTWR